MPTLHLYGVTLSISSVLAVLFFRDENIEECYTFNLHKTLTYLDDEVTNLGYALSILLTQNNNTLGLPTPSSTTTPLSNIILVTGLYLNRWKLEVVVSVSKLFDFHDKYPLLMLSWGFVYPTSQHCSVGNTLGDRLDKRSCRNYACLPSYDYNIRHRHQDT